MSQTQAAPRVSPGSSSMLAPVLEPQAARQPNPARPQEGRGPIANQPDAFQPGRQGSFEAPADGRRFEAPTDGRRSGARASEATGDSSPRASDSSRGALWRQLSVVGCLAGVLVVGFWLRQGLNATPNRDDDSAQQDVTSVETGDQTDTDQPAETTIPLPLNNDTAETAGTDDGAPPSDPFNGTITVADFPIVDTMQVGVLGSDIRTAISADATTVDVATPAGITTVIGLWEGETIRGLTIVNQPQGAAGPDQNTISPSTTAQTLIALYPGVLTSDVAKALDRSSALVGSDSFIQLADAIRDRGGVILDTPDIAIALSGAINALPGLERRDPSCGTNAPDTVASGGGVCFSGDSPPVATNEIDRWNVMLDASSKTVLCGAVAPKGQAKSVVGENCGTEQLVVGPGPVFDSAEIDDNDRRAVRGAAGLHSFAEYGLVLNDLILGQDSRSDAASNDAIIAVAPRIVEQAVALSEADTELAEEGLVLGAVDAHANIRVTAIIDMTRAMMFSEAPTIVGQEAWSESSFAVGLTNLYRQSTEWVSKSAAIPSWTEPAVTLVDVTGAGAGAEDNNTTGDTTGTGDGTGTGDATGGDGTGSDDTGTGDTTAGDTSGETTDETGGEGQ